MRYRRDGRFRKGNLVLEAPAEIPTDKVSKMLFGPSIPKNEEDVANHILFNLHDINKSIIDLYACVELFESSRMHTDTMERSDPDYKKFHRYLFIAAAHGAIVINSVDTVMQALSGSLLYRCTTLFPGFDLTKKKAAISHLQQCFPGIARVRHDAAHRGEFSATPERTQEHGTGGVDSPLFYASGNIQNGNEYMCTVGGEIVTYKLNEQAVSNLRDAGVMMFEAIEAAWPISEEMERKRREEAVQQPPTS
jgi:hypothetical protein